VTMTYRQQAEQRFVPPVSVAAGRQLGAEYRTRILNIHAQLDAAGPAAVGSEWHRRAVEARCHAAADLVVLEAWFADPRPVHAAGCRCEDCTVRSWGGQS
jgi:hypothetical protein